MLTFTVEILEWKLPFKIELLIIWINQVVKIEKKNIARIDYKFITDKELLKMNKGFLNHNYYTDVITFPQSRGNRLAGDIAISVERVKENATLLNTTFNQELKRVIIHGVLHLCGYNDATEEEKKTMRLKENKYLSIYPV